MNDIHQLPGFLVVEIDWKDNGRFIALAGCDTEKEGRRIMEELHIRDGGDSVLYLMPFVAFTRG